MRYTKILDDLNDSFLAELTNSKISWLLLFYPSDKLPSLFTLPNQVFNDTKAIEGSLAGKKTFKFYPFTSL
jgi:hypothetical protein